MTLKECLADIYDTEAARMEVLISDVEGYPNPSGTCVDSWLKHLEIHKLDPAELGYSQDTRVYGAAAPQQGKLWNTW